ncbi:type IV secretory system conjugative DNA transfer family protein [Dactylosporangium sp. NPDC048998]|uniref:type IV secretory system conjugative DNA transfer family protein n=1 Tax=Dactylosporangium sp. NPDC048998 TaxID=3363976 RepID=UPI00371C273C
MPRPSLSSPGHQVPQRGWTRADLWTRGGLLAGIAAVAVLAGWTLWLAGQLGGFLTHGTWPAAGPVGILLRLPGHLGDPAAAWPAPARPALPPAWLLYLLWGTLFAAHVGAAVTAGAQVIRRYARRKGFARRRDVDGLLSADAVRARTDIVRPGLTVTDRDTPAEADTKAARRADPLETGRFLGVDTLTGQRLYLANEYSRLAAGVPRFSGKTSRIVIPAILDARGAVITTGTRLEAAEITYHRRSALGPTFVFEPRGTVPGIPRLRWSPIDGAEDPTVAWIRANGFAAGAGLSTGVENGEYFRQQAAMLIRALLHAAAIDEHATTTDVLSWAQTPSNPRAEQILRHHGVHAWADRLALHRESSGRGRESIQAVVSGALDTVSDPRVLAAVSPPRGEQFDAAAWLAEQGTLYLVGTRDAQASVAPLLAAISEDLLHRAREQAFLSPGGRLEPALYYIGDEISNVAPLTSLPSLMSEAGGSGVVVDVLCQNRHQLHDRWGRAGGAAIEASANCILHLGGSADVAALRDAQALAGQVREVSSSHNWGGGRASVCEQVRRENVLDLAELRTLPAGRAVALIGNLSPVELTIPAWYERDDAPALREDQAGFRRTLATAGPAESGGRS